MVHSSWYIDTIIFNLLRELGWKQLPERRANEPTINHEL